MRTQLGLAVLLAFACYSVVCQLPQDDQVETGIPGYPHAIYSGYLDIVISNQSKSIHYVYFQSQKDHSKDPLVLWLAGGPGCSGLINMLQENGPIVFPPGAEKPVINENAWNKRAGIVYFQAPAGVGYSESLKNQTITDQIVTHQLITALSLFIERHANLKKNDFYIAGTGYGAVWAANLARAIINRNKDESLIFQTKINIKGILLGNPCVYPDECFASGSQRSSLYHYEFLYNRGFFPKPLYLDYLGKCAMVVDPYSCYLARQGLDKIYNSTNTSAYNIYAKCYNNSMSNSINLGCQDELETINYLNDPHFKQNWHIRGNKTWEPCNKKIWNQYHPNPGNTGGCFHLLHDLIKDGMRLWVYSGDMDSTVPITGTKFWVNHYKMLYQVPIRKNWRQWWIPGRHKGQDQVGGFIWELQGLNVVTVKAAGFKTALDQPVSMEIVLNGFLDGKTLPYQA